MVDCQLAREVGCEHITAGQYGAKNGVHAGKIGRNGMRQTLHCRFYFGVAHIKLELFAIYGYGLHRSVIYQWFKRFEYYAQAEILVCRLRQVPRAVCGGAVVGRAVIVTAAQYAAFAIARPLGVGL